MLRRLFKSRQPLTHPDAAVRRSAVTGLSDADAAQMAGELGRLLRDDPDPQVRLACLVRVRDRALLQSLLDDPHLGEAAARRLEALAPDPESGREPQGSPVDAVLSLPPAEAAVQVRALEDVETLITVVLKSRGELRRVALEHPLLGQAAALTRLEKRTRHKDKSLNRHARTRLDRYRQLTSEAEARCARARELAAALGRNPQAVQDHAWRERQHQLREWLEAALDEYAVLRGELAAFGDAPADLEPLRPEPLPEPAAETPVDTTGEPAAAGVEPADGIDPFAELVVGFEELDRSLTAGRAFEEVAGHRQDLTARWLTAADHQPPTDAQHRVFETVSHRFRELADAAERLARAEVPALPAQPLEICPPEDARAHRALWESVGERRRLHKRLDQILRQVRWPEWAPPSAELANLGALTESLREELSRADEVLSAELGKLDELIVALEGAIDEGSLNDAQSLLARTRTLHDALPEHAVRPHGKRVGRQAARLAELKDWQTFATSPKRESLAQAMETLAAEPLAPPEQAERIKALRREWQALGPLTQAADGRLADRFNGAAEKAFEPCRAHFAEQAEARKANLEERRRICDALERYLEDTDWSQADMKGAETIMRAARDEWRRFHPVDRNPGKKVEARFEQLQERLHDLVKTEWERNLAAKEAIVARAESLIEADLPIPEKVVQAKQLQREWRDVGLTPRRPDQRLWRAFRNACDRIFSARDESRDAADAAIESLAAKLAEQLDTFATLIGERDAASASDAELRRFRQETDEVNRLPPPRRRALNERRAQLMTDYGALLDAQRRAGREEALEAFARWDEAMTATEMARRDGGEAEAPAPPAGAAGLLEARLASDGEAPWEAARRLAVKAELIAGLESPDEDEPLRLEVQVERLQAGLSGSAREEGPQALAEAWCRLGPKDDRFAGLRERTFAAISKLS